MAMPAIKVVCFDIGGVLVRHCRTWREGCAAAGLPLREGAEHPDAAKERKALAHLLTTGRLDEHEFYRRMAETARGLYTALEIARIHHAWLGAEYEGVGAVVRRLVRTGRARTGALSNTNGPHWRRYTAPSTEYPTAALLQTRLASHEIGQAKPDAGAFEAFERAVACPGPDILFLDDLTENLAAAAARGWRTEQIDHTRETAPQIEAVLARWALI